MKNKLENVVKGIEFQFNRQREGHLILNINTGNQKMIPCVVDTGLPISCIRKSIAKKFPYDPFDRPVTMNGKKFEGGILTEKIQFVKSIGREDETVLIGNVEFFILDDSFFKSLEYNNKHNISMILGIQCLEMFSIAMDFEKKQISLNEPIKKDHFKKIELTYDEDRDVYFLFFEGMKDIRFLLDTGSFFNRISRQTIDRLNFKGTKRRVPVGGLSGREVLREFVCDDFLGFGRFSALSETKDKNLLGLDFLSQFNVVMDFPNKGMYLYKSPSTSLV